MKRKNIYFFINFLDAEKSQICYDIFNRNVRTFIFQTERRFDMKFINIGFGNMVSAERIISIVSPESAPIKRMIQDARDSGRAIDCTCGRKTRCIVIMDSDHVILSAIQPETIAHRVADQTDDEDDEDDEPHTIYLNEVEEEWDLDKYRGIGWDTQDE